jgi:hypothetical protein
MDGALVGAGFTVAAALPTHAGIAFTLNYSRLFQS